MLNEIIDKEKGVPYMLAPIEDAVLMIQSLKWCHSKMVASMESKKKKKKKLHISYTLIYITNYFYFVKVNSTLYDTASCVF